MDASSPAAVSSRPFLRANGGQLISLSSLPPRRGERRLALIVGLASAAVFAAAVPFARVPLPRLDGFIPVYESALTVSDLITAILLFGQFAFTRSRALLVLASGYLFTASIAGVHILSFPGAFSPTGWLATGPQTTAWLYMVWHAGFPAAVTAYAVLKRRDSAARPMQAAPRAAIAGSIITVGLVVAAVAVAVTAGHDFLPRLMRGNSYAPLLTDVVLAVWAITLCALVVLWRGRPHSVLDTWLMVVMCAWLCDIALSALLNAGRFDLGFYAGRIYGLLAASFVLLVLLLDTVGLYALACGALDERTMELAKSNAKLQALIDASPSAIIALDLDARVVTWGRGAEKIFGYAADEVVGRPYPLVPQGGWEEFERLFRRVVVNGEIPRDVAAQRQRKDGTVRDIVFSGAPLHDADLRVIGAVYTLDDVTEKKKVEQKLVQAQKMEAVGQLTGGIAHDFNNILGLIIGNLDQLLEVGENPGDVKVFGTAALNAAMQASQLIKRLLAFSRNQPLQPKVLDLGGVARGMEPLLRRALGERITIETQIAEGAWPVLADPAQFENAILNLAINARDAMPNGGRLTIACKNTTLDEAAAAATDLPVGDFVTLSVSDTGTGMRPDVLAHVFEPFFTTKEVGKGSGLGLSMVYGYARQSGGAVKIYSEVGHGTDVRLYLPRAADAGATRASTAAKPAPLPTGKETILAVEDKPEMRQMVVKLLQSLGYRVIDAADADAALAVLGRGEAIDLLFTDLVMPGAMTGAELAREVRRRFPAMPIVFTTGFSDPETIRTEAATLGATTVTKPYRKAELATHLRAALDRRVPEPTVP